MNTQASIEFSGVTKSFGQYTALDNVSLAIQKGEFTTLLGPSGCGKTTLLRLVAGFYEPEKGEIRIDGVRMNGVPPFKRNTPLVFQDYALFPHMTVFENVAYGLAITKMKKAEIRLKVADMLRTFGLEGMEKRFPRQLSGGQQQRVAFARALVLGRNILLLDEPLSNLDAKLRVEVRDELKEIQRRFSVTMVYVTHDQEEALAMSDTIAVMDKGRVIQTGSPKEIYYKPANRFVADFVGLANFIPAQIGDGESGLVARAGAMEISVGSGGGRLKPGDSATLLVRPESISLGAAGESAPGAGDCCTGTIEGCSFLGSTARYKIRALGTTFIVDDPDCTLSGVDGDAVLIGFDREKIRLLPEQDTLGRPE